MWKTFTYNSATIDNVATVPARSAIEDSFGAQASETTAFGLANAVGQIGTGAKEILEAPQMIKNVVYNVSDLQKMAQSASKQLPQIFEASAQILKNMPQQTEKLIKNMVVAGDQATDAAFRFLGIGDFPKGGNGGLDLASANDVRLNMPDDSLPETNFMGGFWGDLFGKKDPKPSSPKPNSDIKIDGYAQNEIYAIFTGAISTVNAYEEKMKQLKDKTDSGYPLSLDEIKLLKIQLEAYQSSLEEYVNAPQGVKRTLIRAAELLDDPEHNMDRKIEATYKEITETIAYMNRQ